MDICLRSLQKLTDIMMSDLILLILYVTFYWKGLYCLFLGEGGWVWLIFIILWIMGVSDVNATKHFHRHPFPKAKFAY